MKNSGKTRKTKRSTREQGPENPAAIHDLVKLLARIAAERDYSEQRDEPVASAETEMRKGPVIADEAPQIL
jgi:hypothetical protein